MFRSGRHARPLARSIYRRPALAVLTAFMMLTATVALADNLDSDGDGLTPVVNQDISFGTVCTGAVVDRDVLHAIRRTGAVNSQVFANGATVTVSITGDSSANLAATMGADTQILLPANWTTSPNNTVSTDTASSNIEFTAPGAPGSFSGTVSYSASGAGATVTTTTRTDTVTVTATVEECAPADETPPVISPNVSGTLGNNGWYTSDVTVSWTVSDPDSSISSSSGCGTTTINTDTTGTTLTCTATSAGGTSSESVTIKRDATDPTDVATDLNRVPDHDGWYNAPVAWTTTGTDATSGIASCSSGTYNGPDGTGLTVSGTCADNAGNTSAPASSAVFKYDNTDPTVSVTGVTDGATYILGSVPTAVCDTQDNLSGVQTFASLTMSGPGTTNPNGVGSFTATCTGGLDYADNSQAAPVSASYWVIYDPAGISGILQPINSDNTSLFSRGKAVPVKFRLAGDESNGFDYSGWTLRRIQISCTAFDSEEANLEPVVDNPSNTFRYDAGADQYINNASFKDQAAGTCWKVRVTLDSGQIMDSAVFRLQK